MKPAMWYTTTFFAVFFYLYVYLVQHIRGADITVPLRNFKPLPVQLKHQSKGLVDTHSLTQLGGNYQSNPRISAGIAPSIPPIEFQYHNYEELTAFLKSVSTAYPQLTALYSIGKTVQGRELWVLVLSATPFEHVAGIPEFKYVGNIHGNEPVGKEMLLHLIRYMVTNYGQDEYVRWLMDNTRIHILPSLNPDGFEVAREGDCQGVQGRYNIRGYDLNRNFPDYFRQNNRQAQPETEAIQRWVSENQFVLSAGLHGGALVASYPFDNKPAGGFLNSITGFSSSLTPDNDVFSNLAYTYSINHGSMHLGKPCSAIDPGFPNGTTNGAAWYYLTGGMQDYNYVWHGCMEITLELSCCKYPPAAELPKFWDDNKIAMLKFIGETHRGVRGFVVDTNENPIVGASVKIKDRDVGMTTTKLGEYWRILMPGIYTIEVYAEGYVPTEQVFQVTEENPTIINVILQSSNPGVLVQKAERPRPNSVERPQQQSFITRLLGNFIG